VDLDRLSILVCEESKRRERDQDYRCEGPANHDIGGVLFVIARLPPTLGYVLSSATDRRSRPNARFKVQGGLKPQPH
jgi:hypothetical protein